MHSIVWMFSVVLISAGANMLLHYNSLKLINLECWKVVKLAIIHAGYSSAILRGFSP